MKSPLVATAFDYEPWMASEPARSAFASYPVPQVG